MGDCGGVAVVSVPALVESLSGVRREIEEVGVVDVVWICSRPVFVEIPIGQLAHIGVLGTGFHVGRGAGLEVVIRAGVDAVPVKDPVVAEGVVQIEVALLTSAQLDDLLGKHVEQMQQAPTLDDARFLTRLTLDLVGRQPTVSELESFLILNLLFCREHLLL